MGANYSMVADAGASGEVEETMDARSDGEGAHVSGLVPSVITHQHPSGAAVSDASTGMLFYFHCMLCRYWLLCGAHLLALSQTVCALLEVAQNMVAVERSMHVYMLHAMKIALSSSLVVVRIYTMMYIFS